jgi:hypothetical protein
LVGSVADERGFCRVPTELLDSRPIILHEPKAHCRCSADVSGAIDSGLSSKRRALCGLHPEKQDEDDTENEERQRTSEDQVVLPIELRHETAAPSKLGSAR